MVPLWPCGSAACSLKFPPAWTSCPFSTSFTKPFGKWGEKQRGVSVRCSSAKTSPRSACPLPLPSPPAIKSCPPQPPQSWLRSSPRELRANAEPPRLHCSRASRSSDVRTPSSDNGQECLFGCHIGSFSIKLTEPEGLQRLSHRLLENAVTVWKWTEC